jgi:hypothetical protein
MKTVSIEQLQALAAMAQELRRAGDNARSNVQNGKVTIPHWMWSPGSSRTTPMGGLWGAENTPPNVRGPMNTQTSGRRRPATQ